MGLIRRGRQGRPRRRHSLCRPLAVVALAAAAVALPATAAVAALQPGTPIAVPPGVPGQGRAWELITPPDSNSAKPTVVSALEQNGDGMVYVTAGNLPGAPSGYPNYTVNVARRGPSGWTNTPVVAPPDPRLAPSIYYFLGPQLVAPDFSAAAWIGKASDSATGLDILRSGLDDNYRPVSEIDGLTDFVGGSADTRRLFFTSSRHRLPADATRTEGASLYELDDSTVRLVDVGNDGSLISNCGSIALEDDAISSDGRRVYFLANPSCAGTRRLYLRENASTTTEVSASHCNLPDCGPEADVSFAGATLSGSSAFLFTAERLTDDDTNEHSDLYRFDVASGSLTLISSRAGADLSPSGRIQVSNDGSRVYFSASGGYYLAEGNGAPRFLTTSARDYQAVSADGRYLAFATGESLSPDDTDGMIDVYRYDAVSEAMTLLSGGPESGNGPVEFEPTYFAEPHRDFFSRPAIKSRPFHAMTASGDRVFFSTSEPLIASDRNHVKDVYEWANGSLSLISYGDEIEAIFLGVTRDGRTAFFETPATLLPSDRDGGDTDFYAARIGGGFPEPAAPRECEDPACRSVPGSALARTTPASAHARSGIAVRPLDRSALRGIVASGWIELLVEVPAAGRLTARARARIGSRPRMVASAVTKPSGPGPVLLRMRLSSAARESLEHGKDLRVSLALRLPSLNASRTLSFGLKADR